MGARAGPCRPRAAAEGILLGRLKRFGAIGFGAITEEMMFSLERTGELDALSGILVLDTQVADAQERAAGRFVVATRIEELLATRPTVVMEAASQHAVRQYGTAVLAAGIDFMCASVGALADEEFTTEMRAARRNGARIWIPSGAVAGIDGLLAARSAGLREVTYTSIKGPDAWRGTPGEAKISRAERVTLFEGTAREAAKDYPQNANVAATVSFAGIGLDRTRVKLVSDPQATGPLGLIEAAGDFGTFRFEILAYASPRNPKTSAITAHSMLTALRDGVCLALD